MLSTIVDYIEEIKDQFVPIVARAEDEVEETNDGEEEEDDDDDDEDEDEEETKDQYDELKEECLQTEKGKALKHHYDECAARVQLQKEQPGYDDLENKEDCVEEFFHLQHYLDSCAAPRLFNKLK
ncbi:similar to Saccharomyces cerevisiae YFR033C QCR6 Subunit 6 of the ubiquinol cytochrome-c reductase complex, which is a component of the mitochondrial inner membrane electron transport chain [Maudiozyma barnettii]|uniref:Cytochrome b-c1 complex subunit 6, mitochondrial n=1 Tax=Maudiozyma barnettii TaxID=61262 RepID=A0A8H2ZJA4_9SACH|nr:ubiquinol--cytochrome-c reductase subunit 6 [Kazachstania barnettii]CAB4254047.1 similar to Saccharomyces cerevisiae YFR033C QCR6 Subunit 6 of the ubiquinol cytochrome-c reductase complex, which is a component of the mitochondrial inner membrane electron transport chain [Kazachstania barnettii]CAD1781797.1 similar to Saccharomyces cerevisiae YFR033C QCR6 Subunit 6 of the ubiquinol cytochrome-c reductase complex, which is a component of the mitochondrial inner membrane electron transport chain 